jgi:hypothetical protein
VRDDFVTPWVAWDIVRTLASTAAFASLTWALVLRPRIGRAEQPQRADGYVPPRGDPEPSRGGMS